MCYKAKEGHVSLLQLYQTRTAERWRQRCTLSATKHAQGAWNEHEQHMAPATGVLTAELSQFAPQNNMRIARISLDILGLIPLDDFIITTRCIRPGKTIELIESVMSSRGRDCIIARAWRLMTQDTSEIAGLEDQKALHQPDELPVWDDMKGWPGGFIERCVWSLLQIVARAKVWFG